MQEAAIMRTNHEIVERFCHIVGKNVVLSKTVSGKQSSVICLSSYLCSHKGECANNKAPY